MKTFGLAAIAAIAALILGFGSQLSAPTAHADATSVVVVGCEALASAGVGSELATPVLTNRISVASACGAGSIPSTDGTADAVSIQKIAHNLHKSSTVSASNDKLSASDLTTIAAYAGNQITSPAAAGNNLVVFAFVDNEATVKFDAPTGLTFDPADTGSNDFTCDTDLEDADCNPVAPNNGDGVVTARLLVAGTNAAAAGSSPTVTITQGTGTAQTATVNVVGAAHDVVLTLTKATIQSQSSTDFSACKSGADVTDSSVTSDPNMSIAIATVTDSDGTKLARVPVTLTSGATTTADKAVGTPGIFGGPTGNTAVTLVSSSAGTAYFAVVCAGTATGTATLTASISTDSDKEDITVVGAPSAIALTASPAAVDCNGTNSSTVTAKVTDSSGNNVADGTTVTFSVVALGTANPINTTTTAGSATTTVTPLSVATQGVTVTVTSGSAANQIRVDCNIAAAVPSPVASPTAPGGTITGPNTGTGGYLGQDSSAGFPLWTLVALALGSFALIGGGLVARRAGK